MSTTITEVSISVGTDDSTDVPPGYKRTEVGVIPEDWEVATAAQVCELVVDCKNRTPPVVDGDEFAVVRTPNVRNGKFLREDLRFTDKRSFIEWTARAVPQFGDVLITREAPLGEVCLVPNDLKICLGQRMMLYRPDRAKIDSAFLLYALMSTAVRSNLLAKIGGSTVGHAKVDDIRNLQIPFPPFKAEQRSIAEALSDIDSLIEALEKLIAKKQAIKQGAMKQLLNGRTRLPGFSGEWKLKSIGELTDCTAGGTPNTQYAEYWGGTIRWMSSGELNLKIVHEVEGRITEAGLRNSSTKMIPPKCVLIGLAGQGKTRGTVAMNMVPLCTNQSIAAIFPNDSFVPEFLYFSLDARYDELRAMSTGDGGRGGLNLRIIRSIVVPFPSFEEQKAIAAVLSDMDAEIAALERRLDKTRQIKQGMMQQLLTGRVRLLHQDASAGQLTSVPRETKVRNWQINEAVLIGVLANQFGSEQYPLGRKRYTKLSYLLHRHAEHKAEGYLKKAASPYNPKTRYGGPEKIALQNGYIQEHTRQHLIGFVAGDNIAQAEGYFDTWYGAAARQWLEQFRYKTNDELELLATVVMAVEELRDQGAEMTVTAVKGVLQADKEWEAKLSRDVFSDDNIAEAIETCRMLFDERKEGLR